jgi:hypothetical protein
MLDLSDILDMCVGHPGVCWTCMHSFHDFMCIMDMYRRFGVWIHVEIETDVEMWFICYIVDIYVVFWFIC